MIGTHGRTSRWHIHIAHTHCAYICTHVQFCITAVYGVDPCYLQDALEQMTGP